MGLRKLVLGGAGTHFHDGKWANTILPIMFVTFSQESTPNFKRAIDALIACVQLRLDINLVDLVLEWFWDGAGEAMPVLGDAFPGVPGHMCLQHSKV